ncbi:MAG: hypothetical protein JXK07_13430 [Spirochaetes bacterium]|nr:hypothetical protein [Spirochaetota bacterium]
MYQAYSSMKPISNEKCWMTYVGETIDEVRKLVRDNEIAWYGVYISKVDEVHK